MEINRIMGINRIMEINRIKLIIFISKKINHKLILIESSRIHKKPIKKALLNFQIINSKTKMAFHFIIERKIISSLYSKLYIYFS